jgi:hypothetical protein
MQEKAVGGEQNGMGETRTAYRITLKQRFEKFSVWKTEENIELRQTLGK